MNKKQLKRISAFLLAVAYTLNLAISGIPKKEKGKVESGVSTSESDDINDVSNDFTTYQEQIDEINPEYSLEDIYFTDEEIEELVLAASSEAECTNDTVRLDALEIANRIIENSNNGAFVIYDDMSEEEKQKLNDLIAESLKTVISNMISQDVLTQEDVCSLQSFKLIVGPSSASEGNIIAYNNPENILLLDYNHLLQTYDNIKQDFVDEDLIQEGVRKYLEYSINCCRLKACPCRLEQGQINEYALGADNFGTLEQMSIMSGDNTKLSVVNELLFDSQKLYMNRSASLILLLASFKENRTIEDFNKLILNSDLSGIFDYFGLTTDEEIADFYRILNTINILTISNDYKTEFYEENGSVDVLKFRNYVGYAYKEDLFKYSIQDLMKYITKAQDLTKEEAMFLYKFVKTIVVSNTFTDSEDETYQYDQNYVKHIITIENVYFEFLTKFYGMTMDEVDALYEDDYHFILLEQNDKIANIDYGKLVEKFPLLLFIQMYYSADDENVLFFDRSTCGR